MGFLQRNKRTVFGCVLALIAVITIVSLVTKAQNMSGPSVKPGEYVRNDFNLATPSDSKSVTTGNSETNNQVISSGITPEPKIETIQTIQTSSLTKFVAGPTHTTYGPFWALANGDVWVYTGNNTSRDTWLQNNSIAVPLNVYKGDNLNTPVTVIDTMGIPPRNVVSIDNLRVLVAYGFDVLPTVVKLYRRVTTSSTYVEQEGAWASHQENIGGLRGFSIPARIKGSFGDRMMVRYGYIYITGSEYSPETKNGVVYVYDLAMQFIKLLVDPKMVALLVAGYEYEKGGQDFGASMDVTPDGKLLVIGCPYGDIKNTSITFPGSQQSMPNGFFMLFEQWVAKTDPLDDYYYLGRITIPSEGFGNVVKFMSNHFVMVATTSDNILYVFYIASQAIPKLMTRITFPYRVMAIYSENLIQTSGKLYYVDWQKPLVNSATNLFGTLVIRDSLNGIWKYNGSILLSDQTSFTINV